MTELNWKMPDKDSTYNQTYIYRSTSKYGTYSLLDYLTNIRTTNYNDKNGLSTYWYKIRFYDSVNAIWSDYSLPIQASSTVSDTNYTTPEMVAKFLGAYRQVVAQAISTGNSVTTNFSLPAPDNLPIAGTETIYVNGTAKVRNVDYTMDYDNGIVQFASAPGAYAITGDWLTSTFVPNSQYVKSIRRAEDEIDRRTGRTFYQPQTITEVIDSFDPLDISPFSFEPLDYTSSARQYRSQTSEFLTNRVIQLEHYPVISVSQILLNQQPTNEVGEDVGTGNGVLTAFQLDNFPVVSGSEIIYVAGVSVTNYTINYSTGAITFTGTPPTGAVTADYQYCPNATVLTADQYMVRKDEGIILFKKDTTQVNKDLSIATIVYSYGFYQPPPIIENLATSLAAVKLVMTTNTSTPSALSINANNLGVYLGEIRSSFDSIGRKMTLTRI